MAAALLESAMSAPPGQRLATHVVDGEAFEIHHGQRLLLADLKSRPDLNGWWAVAVRPLQEEAAALETKRRVKVVTLGTREVLSLSILNVRTRAALAEPEPPWMLDCLYVNDTFAVVSVPERGFGLRAIREIHRGEIVLTEEPIMSVRELAPDLLQDPNYAALASALAEAESDDDDGSKEAVERCSMAMSNRLVALVFPTLTASQQARWMALQDSHSELKSPSTIFQTNATANRGLVSLYFLLSRINHVSMQGLKPTGDTGLRHTCKSSCTSYACALYTPIRTAAYVCMALDYILTMLLFELAHGKSCMPNVYQLNSNTAAVPDTREEKGSTAVLKALFDIPFGEQLFLSYDSANAMAPTAQRRATLQRRYNFVCSCERCGPADGKPYDGPTAAGLRERGDALFASGQLAEACQAYHRALNCWDAPRARERSELLCRFAGAFLRIGDSRQGKKSEHKLTSTWYEKALEKAEEAVAEDATLWLAYQRKGDALARMNRTSDAKAAHSMAKSLRHPKQTC
jgi:hypothetical protein